MLEQTLEKILLEKSKSLLTGIKVEHKNFGAGLIKEVLAVDETYSSRSSHELLVRANIYFNGTIKKMVISYKLFDMLDVDSEEFKNFLDETKDTLEDAAQAKYEAVMAIKKKQEEAQKQKDKEEAFKRKMERDLAKVQNYKVKHITKNATAELYYTIGWIAKHVARISAAMPDYLEHWFRNQFKIKDEDIRVIDSNYRTPAGWQEQWGLGMTIRFNLKNTTNIPDLVAPKIKKNNINSVDFVWDLIENYNFSFGKEQDITKIKETVPEKYMIDFEDGLAA